MRLNRQQIMEMALSVIGDHPQGIRWSDLLRAVVVNAPGTPQNSIHGAIHILLKTKSTEIIKVARGTYRLSKFIEAEEQPSVLVAEVQVPVNDGSTSQSDITEQNFYKSFADWLIENDEVTEAVSLGGNVLGGKWGTPDVIGVLKPRAQDIFKFVPQIISAEIKVNPGQPVVAFGQAVAYRLFSHKSYIVIPNSTASEDVNRLKSLCSIHGVGLVIFSLNRDNPDYTVIVLPKNADPDMFYVNYMLDRLKTSDPDILNKLF